MFPLYLIDSYALIYRSYFAFLKRPLRNTAGKNVSVLFGFARTLAGLLNNGAPVVDEQEMPLETAQKPPLLAAVFDPKGKTFRHELYAEYKANRQKTPEDLHAQVPLVEEFLAALNIPILRADGFEADDVIATLVKKCRAEKRLCYILSGDKDLLQLVGGGVYELRPSKTAGKIWDLIGAREVQAEWGVPPVKMLDLLSLTGDASDNVPGVKGIGEKSAVKLMARYGSLEEIFNNIAGIEGAIGKKLAKGKESAWFSKTLVALRDDVPLPVSAIDELSIENIHRSAGAAILVRENCRETAELYDADALSSNSLPEKDAQIAPRSALAFGAAVPNAEVDTADEELLGEGAYHTVLDIEELRNLLDEAHKRSLMAFDFETDSLDAWNAIPVGFSLSFAFKEAVYVPVASHGMGSPFIDPELARSAIKPLFEDPGMTIIAHNAKYDYEVSRRWGIDRWQCNIWDTMIAAWLNEPDRAGFSLDSLAGYYFNYTPLLYKDIVPKDETFASVPLEIATRYSAEDADLCFRLKALFEKKLRSAELISLFQNLEMPLLPILAEMEGEGIMIEKQALADYGDELTDALETLEARIFALVGHDFNILSTQQLQKVLFEERKLKPGKKTKTGYSTDMAVLEELARNDPVPAMVLRHRTLSRLKSTYVDSLASQADAECRIHTSFLQTGTVTGRLSSKDPNLQNIPIRDEEGRRIREAFIAKDGHLLISADYSQIELVVLAHLSEDPALVSAFCDGKDVHARTASLIFGVAEDAVLPEQRRVAKVINFGVMYGMSAFRLSNELDISRHEAAAFIEAYFRTYSGINNLIGGLVKQCEETGFASTLLGRRRFIPAINSTNKTEKAAAERIAVNTPIQGSAADIVKTAMLNVDRALAATRSSAKLLLQVHDELIFEVPENDAEEAAALVREYMENTISLKVPLRVSVEIGKRWGDFH
ncbi:MAG: DNA polymerase I [Treponema sp.]|jgi:DNA polymerase-1|nr:DNA polymerase I [Treponema sp.]